MLRSRAAASLAVLLALPCLPAVSPAQVVSGRVVERGSGSPAPGALLALVDTAGERAASTLADGDGAYRLTAPRAGRYRIRVERIGFRTWTSEPLELGAGETRSLRLEVPVVPVRLSGLEARVESRCRSDPGEGPVTARLWSEARKALQATAWTEEEGLLRFEVDRWRRTLSDDLAVKGESHRTKTGWGIRPFVSAPADWLAEEGWVQGAGAARTYYGPDARALLSDAFRRTHCFGVREEGPEDGWIGLTFRPVPGHERPDVVGVMWLDETTAELRRVEFRYVNADLPPGSEHAGGRVAFRRLPNGAWIVRRWRLRMPTPGRRRMTVPGAPVSGGGARSYQQTFVAGYREEGGRVSAVWGPDGEPVSTAPRAWAAGVVRTPDGEPGTGVEVFVAGARRAVRPDSAGRFRIELPKPGEHRVAVRRPGAGPAADSVLAARTVRPGPGETASVELTVPAAEDPPADAAQPTDAGRDRAGEAAGAAVAGRVEYAETGAPVASARVQVAGRTAVTDSAGRFRIGGLPTGPAALTVEHLDTRLRRPDLYLPAGETVRATLRLQDEPVRLADLSVTVEGTRATGKMSGFWERKTTGGQGVGSAPENSNRSER